jgi:hypothetical protein
MQWFSLALLVRYPFWDRCGPTSRACLAFFDKVDRLASTIESSKTRPLAIFLVTYLPLTILIANHKPLIMAVSSHYYAILFLIPLSIGELTRT